jgi:alpha-tubulin suppressor-like RCC1 family protein
MRAHLFQGSCIALCLALGIIIGAISCSNTSTNNNPTACPNAFTTCNGQCTATQFDPANCGACGNACPTGQLCQSGGCSAASCMMGFTSCGGGCVDVTKDVNNCGACGNACPDGQRCASGQCADSCPTGSSACPASGPASYCADLQNDRQDCGACGKTCAADQVCMAGACQCDITSMTAAHLATCTLQGDGTVRCGGFFGYPVNRFVPVPISSVKSLEAGGSTACALKTDGTVWCWGQNGTFQLGNADNNQDDHVATPVQVQTNDTNTPGSAPMFLTGVVQLSVGGEHSCALDSSGQVWCWGKNDSQQLGNSGSDSPFAVQAVLTGVTGISKVVAGNTHSCAFTAAGNVWCWGGNGNNQTGNPGNTGEASEVLTPDSSSEDGGVASAPLAGIVDITTGYDHTCAIKSDHTVWCWGDNTNGQLGVGDTSTHPTAVEVLNADATPLGGAATIATGEMHTCVAKMDGTVWCWGDNGKSFGGQLGNDSIAQSSVPVQVLAAGSTPAPLTGATALEAGHRHTCALIGATHQMYCWGVNGKDQIGVPSRDVHVATLVPTCR